MITNKDKIIKLYEYKELWTAGTFISYSIFLIFFLGEIIYSKIIYWSIAATFVFLSFFCAFKSGKKGFEIWKLEKKEKKK